MKLIVIDFKDIVSCNFIFFVYVRYIYYVLFLITYMFASSLLSCTFIATSHLQAVLKSGARP